jgi:uncharacterized protein (TIGR03085 family)
MTTPATLERHQLAEELAAAGPDAPTLCEGWTTRDLAAHVILRESRPDAMPGVLVSALSGYTERVQRSIAGRPFELLVKQVGSGPPWWSPTKLSAIDRLANTTEFFVHTEDVRRARPGWEPRELDPELTTDLLAALRRSTRLLARQAPEGVVLEPEGAEPIVVADEQPSVTVRGPVGELVLLLFGRQDQARLEYDGPDASVEALRAADLGI